MNIILKKETIFTVPFLESTVLLLRERPTVLSVEFRWQHLDTARVDISVQLVSVLNTHRDWENQLVWGKIKSKKNRIEKMNLICWRSCWAPR